MTVYQRISGVWEELAISNKISGAWKALTTVGGGGGGGGGVTPCSIGGSLDATGATSNVTGPSRPVTVPSGNSGKLSFQNFTGDGLPLIQVGSGSFSGVSEGDTLTWTDGQSITARRTGLLSGQSGSLDIYDFDTNTFIQTVIIGRS